MSGPRGLNALFAKLRTEPALIGPYAVTGSFASMHYAPIVEPRLVAIYVANIDEARVALALRPAERGANVILAKPYDRVALERTTHRDGITYAALPQVAVDLLTSPGRGPQEGMALIKWMEEHEDVWRQ